MIQKDFLVVLNQRIKKTVSVLGIKAQEYSSSTDRLHNFKRAGAMQGITPEKALIGMLAKHLVSVMDMIDDLAKDQHHPIPVWDEKLGDAINYLCLLEGLIVERSVTL